MLTPQTLLGYVKAKPFRPFRIEMANGRGIEIRHPEMIKILRNEVLVFDDIRQGFSDRWESLSLELAEAISPRFAS